LNPYSDSVTGVCRNQLSPVFGLRADFAYDVGNLIEDRKEAAAMINQLKDFKKDPEIVLGRYNPPIPSYPTIHNTGGR